MPCFRECPDLFRSAPRSANLFLYVFRANRNKSRKPLSDDPFCRSTTSRPSHKTAAVGRSDLPTASLEHQQNLPLGQECIKSAPAALLATIHGHMLAGPIVLCKKAPRERRAESGKTELLTNRFRPHCGCIKSLPTNKRISLKFFGPKFFRGRPCGMSVPKCLFFRSPKFLRDVRRDVRPKTCFLGWFSFLAQQSSPSKPERPRKAKLVLTVPLQLYFCSTEHVAERVIPLSDACHAEAGAAFSFLQGILLC